MAGGAPERWAAALILMAVVGSLLVGPIHLVHFHSLEVDLFMVDTAFFLGVALLALVANRWWPMAMAAFEGFAVLAHVGVSLSPGSFVPKVYAVASAFSAYPTLLILTIGTYRHRRRLARLGTDLSWSISWLRFWGPQQAPNPMH